jgi:hypothetical protein
MQLASRRDRVLEKRSLQNHQWLYHKIEKLSSSMTEVSVFQAKVFLGFQEILECLVTRSAYKLRPKVTLPTVSQTPIALIGMPNVVKPRCPMSQLLLVK